MLSNTWGTLPRLDCGEANQDYHYGATYEVRWVPEDNDEPGQQCTYDRYTW
jgi:hypothetical protein